MVHIYCGDGKGKTTAAIGLCIRAAGNNKKILIARFLKTENSGELIILRNIQNIEVIHCKKQFGFYKNLLDNEKLQAKQMYKDIFKTVLDKVKTNYYDIIMLDEIMAILNYNIISEKEIINFLNLYSDEIEIILTGRNPSQNLIEISDYVSEIKKIKHPFDKGVKARKGIEF